MKVIGKTEGGYILTATEDEIGYVAGVPYVGNASHCREWLTVVGTQFGLRVDHNGLPSVGAEIPVSDWWKRVHQIHEREKELAELADKLIGLADLIKGAWPAITMGLPGKGAKP